MLYFLHGDNQKELKDYLFDVKKRAPLVEEFDAAAAAWEDFFARVKTATFLFSEKKEAARLDSTARQARLIVVSSFTKSSTQFQALFFEHAAELARIPDVIILFEEDEIKDKKFFVLLPPSIKIKRFDTREKASLRDQLTPFLFGCAGAWLRGDRRGALQAAHIFFEHGGSAEALFFVLAAYVKKTKEPHATLRVLRDQFIASRLEKADLRLIMFAFLSR